MEILVQKMASLSNKKFASKNCEKCQNRLNFNEFSSTRNCMQISSDLVLN